MKKLLVFGMLLLLSTSSYSQYKKNLNSKVPFDMFNPTFEKN